MENVMTQLISKTMPVSGGIIQTLSRIVSWEKRLMSPLMSGTDLHRHREFVDTPLIHQNHQECSRGAHRCDKDKAEMAPRLLHSDLPE